MAGFNIMGVILLVASLGYMFLQLCSATRYYDFVLKETNFTRLCSTKSILTVNGSFPGPTIHVHKGETIYVNVHNQGLYGVTIHWHGVKQPRNPWSDGPENITQCPIQAGSNFTYEVVFSNEEGTLWWHAHSDWTRATVHGAIVILPAAGTTYPFAAPHAQQTIILGSWFKPDVMEVINSALATGADPNTSDAFTINGQPGDLYSCSKVSTYHLKVDYGKTYMLRLINAVMNEEQFFAIANHSLTVVGQDAAYLKPITTSYIMITPGQTMDILIKANQPPSHYYMASTAYSDAIVPFHNGTTTAILQYRGKYSTPSTIQLPNLPVYNDTAAADNFTARVRALASKAHPISVPTKITTRIFMTIAINERICPNASCSGPDNNAIAASLNNISFEIPSIDILQAYYGGINGVFEGNFPTNPPRFYNFTGEQQNNTIYPTFGTKVKFIKYGEGVEIIFQGTNIIAPENHPMHLHGFSFYLVGTGYGNFNATTSPKTYNLVDPPEVNTIGVPKNGWATIRFVADNPGVWFMHCHLERHSSWGMDTVIIVRNGNTTNSKLRPPPAHMPPCSKS
ncbi:laccase-15-like [Argentina anserina]|uniref:laccase-15-like n=1 Tax=Argentina anserina TaxID=57926 RepID=UPI00217627DA|nr:laccase-15-like [Potentilla anserina]